MKNKFRYLSFFVLLTATVFGQEPVRDSLWHAIPDSLYRDDQVYLGVSYMLMTKKPSGIKSRGVSGSIQGGFLRDFPVNKNRDLSVAAGLGLAYDQLSENLFIGEDAGGNSIFRKLDQHVRYSQNRLVMAMVEIPVEFRWRTSTPTSYKFWRIYAGARIGYVYWYKASFKQAGNTVVQTSIPEFDPWRISATLSFGYSTFNFFASYSINPLFKNAELESGEKIDLKTLKLGLIFYLL